MLVFIGPWVALGFVVGVVLTLVALRFSGVSNAPMPPRPWKQPPPPHRHDVVKVWGPGRSDSDVWTPGSDVEFASVGLVDAIVAYRMASGDLRYSETMRLFNAVFEREDLLVAIMQGATDDMVGYPVGLSAAGYVRAPNHYKSGWTDEERTQDEQTSASIVLANSGDDLGAAVFAARGRPIPCAIGRP